jgi:hypothetical protein
VKLQRDLRGIPRDVTEPRIGNGVLIQLAREKGVVALGGPVTSPIRPCSAVAIQILAIKRIKQAMYGLLVLQALAAWRHVGGDAGPNGLHTLEPHYPISASALDHFDEPTRV